MSSEPTSTPKVDVPKFIGTAVTVLAGLALVAVTVYLTGDGRYLWALLLIGFGVAQVTAGTREYHWKPAFIGLVMVLVYCVIGGVVWHLKQGSYLWAMILAHWIADQIV